MSKQVIETFLIKYFLQPFKSQLIIKGAISIILLYIFCSEVQAQQNHFQGSVKDTFSKIPLSFVHVIVNDTSHLLTDIDGNFDFQVNYPVGKITFEHYMHRSVSVIKPESNLIITLNKAELFSFSTNTDNKTIGILQKVQQYKKYNDFKSTPFSYTTYNKFTVSADKNDKANTLLLKFAKLMPFKTMSLQDDQHLLIIESATEKKYINDLHQNELITGSRSSNVTIPSVFVESTRLQGFSIYDHFIKIAGIEYISPLITKANDYYAFTLLSEFTQKGNTIFIIKFNPLPGKYFGMLKGLLYVNAKNYAVQNFIAGPAEDGNADMKLIQSYTLHNNNYWFPNRTKTLIVSGKPGSELKFIATGNTFIDHVKIQDPTLKKKDFDEIILEYNKNSETKGNEFWDTNRKEFLTHRDSATFQYYSTWDKKGLLVKFLSFGEHLAYGYMPIGKINVDMHRLFNYNDVEGIRLGFGAHTNERFSDKMITGGYIGYGFRDNRIKFGVDFAQNLFKAKQVWYKVNFAHELTESGGVHFAFDKYQYSSEGIRRFRLRILDFTTELDNAILAHPLKYLDLNVGLNHSRSLTTYSYTYKDKAAPAYNFSEVKAGIRFAYGEQLIKFLSNKKSLGTKYPILYFQFTKGLHDFFGDFDYIKYDYKVEQSIKIRNIGVSSFQLIGGFTFGNAPYQKLYNMRGSLKSPSIVIHNSFETMRYNEFLSDRYISLFFSHNLGKIKICRPSIQPSILFLHNMGFGGMKNPEVHSALPFTFKTMEKGYIESGAFADNILVLNLTGMKTGFGAGLFLRYGPYASLKASDNIVLKFSVNFGI